MSYISYRSQCVQTDGAVPAVLFITSGVVQGSHLGPLVFSMFINDIVYQITSCPVYLYAEDVQIYISCELHCIENCIRNMNIDLGRIHEWSIENCLAINPEKPQALLVNLSILCFANRFTTSPWIKSYCICQQSNKFGQLSWHDQLAKLCSGVFFTLRRFWTFSNFTPVKTRRKLVISRTTIFIRRRSIFQGVSDYPRKA
jgi:hypothetical protein